MGGGCAMCAVRGNHVVTGATSGRSSRASFGMASRRAASPEHLERIKSSKDKMKVSPPSLLRVLATSVPMGLVFGVAFERSQVYVPQMVIDQFLFKRFTMMKVFLTAVATSSFAIWALGRAEPLKVNKARSKYTAKEFAYVSLGASILGIGMALSGSCPGTVAAQVGANVSNAMYTLAGCFAGALGFLLLSPVLEHLSFGGPLAAKLEVHMESMVGKPVHALQLLLSAVLIAATLYLESIHPWKQDTFGGWSWIPEISGAMIGLLQIPAVLSLSTVIGASSSYMVALSTTFRLMHGSGAMHTDIQKQKGGHKTYWQLIYMVSAALGAFLSSKEDGNYGVFHGVGQVRSLIGGFCAVFGSRLASGCTSGHGISGFSMMITNSVVAIVFMFSAAILTSLVVAMF